MKTFSLPHVSIEDISRYFLELTLLRSLVKIKTGKETIFKAQVNNGSEKTGVKQHKTLRGFGVISS